MTVKRKRRDRRTKKDFTNFKAQLVKRGLCRQCGKKRDKKSPSKHRCSRCAKAHALYMKKFRHRKTTASVKGKAKVLKKETHRKVTKRVGKIARPKKSPKSPLRAKVRKVAKVKAKRPTRKPRPVALDTTGDNRVASSGPIPLD